MIPSPQTLGSPGVCPPGAAAPTGVAHFDRSLDRALGCGRHRVLVGAAGVLLFALLTAAGALVRIPLPHTPVPLTLQTVGVLVAGVALGPRLGSLSQALYIVVGLIGAPVFAGGGSGLAYLSGPTAGYLLGFLVAPWVAGTIARPGTPGTMWAPGVARNALATALASVVIFTLGCAWLTVVLGSATAALGSGLYPFALGALLKWGLAATIAVELSRRREAHGQHARAAGPRQG